MSIFRDKFDFEENFKLQQENFQNFKACSSSNDTRFYVSLTIFYT